MHHYESKFEITLWHHVVEYAVLPCWFQEFVCHMSCGGKPFLSSSTTCAVSWLTLPYLETTSSQSFRDSDISFQDGVVLFIFSLHHPFHHFVLVSCPTKGYLQVTGTLCVLYELKNGLFLAVSHNLLLVYELIQVILCWFISQRKHELLLWNFKVLAGFWNLAKFIKIEIRLRELSIII